LGQQITLQQPPRRIITLSPNLAEILCAIGAESQLVGVDDFTKYPPEVADKAKVGGIINPDLERILALQPDLILVTRGLDKERIARLRELACPVAAFDPQSLEEVLALIEQIGQITGRKETAREAATGLRTRLERVRAATHAASENPRVLLVITWEGLFVGGASGFANDLITTAGGVNVVAAMKKVPADQPWPTVTRELVVAADPQVVVFAGGMGGMPGGKSSAKTLALLRQDAAWAHLSAVKAGRVALIRDDLLTIPGPRLFDGLEELHKVLTVRSEGGAHGVTN
jgi:iron complex transport system substrate-binding protein